MTVGDKFKTIIAGKKLEFLTLKNDNAAYIKVGDKTIYMASFNAETNTLGESFDYVHQAKDNQIVLPLVKGGLFNLAADSDENDFFVVNMNENEYEVNSFETF